MQTSKRQSRFTILFPNHITTGSLSITLHHLRIFFRSQHLLHPRFIIRFFYPLRMSRRHKLRNPSLRITTENTTFPLEHRLEFLFRFRNTLYCITFRFQPFQQFIQRRCHFQPCCCQSALSRSFQINNSDTFIPIGHPLQFHLSVNCFYQIIYPIIHRHKLIISVLIGILYRQHLRTPSSVNFRQHNAGREITTCQSTRIILPLLPLLQQSQWTKQRDIPLFKPLHCPIASQTSHR